MINNEFVSYKICSKDSLRNNDNLIDILDISPLKSYEIRIAKMPTIKKAKEQKLNLSIKLNHYNEKKNLYFNVHKLKTKKKNLSTIKTPKKRINVLFFNYLQNHNKEAKAKMEQDKNNNLNGNNNSLAKKVKKFYSCQNLILGKYPINHRLLLPIQREFKVNNFQEKFEDKNKKKKEIYIIDENLEEKNIKLKTIQNRTR